MGWNPCVFPSQAVPECEESDLWTLFPSYVKSASVPRQHRGDRVALSRPSPPPVPSFHPRSVTPGRCPLPAAPHAAPHLWEQRGLPFAAPVTPGCDSPPGGVAVVDNGIPLWGLRAGLERRPGGKIGSLINDFCVYLGRVHFKMAGFCFLFVLLGWEWGG